MSGDLAGFMFANMKGSPRGRKGSWASLGYTGAVIKGDGLYLATVARDDSGRLRLANDLTKEFRLRERHQWIVRECYSELSAFMRGTGIRRVLLRSTSDSRKYAASPEGYALECAFKLVPALSVEVVHRATLDAWSNPERHLLPQPPLGPWQSGQFFKAAIEVAALLEARCSSPET